MDIRRQRQAADVRLPGPWRGNTIPTRAGASDPPPSRVLLGSPMLAVARAGVAASLGHGDPGPLTSALRSRSVQSRFHRPDTRPTVGKPPRGHGDHRAHGVFDSCNAQLRVHRPTVCRSPSVGAGGQLVVSLVERLAAGRPAGTVVGSATDSDEQGRLKWVPLAWVPDWPAEDSCSAPGPLSRCCSI